MILSLIAAIDNHRAIGYQGKMPWHLPADLKYFREKTLGKPIIMGRKTFESIGKPLSGRRNIVISHQKTLEIAGIELYTSIEEALTTCIDVPEVMVIGGATLYTACFPLAQRLYLTQIHTTTTTADTFFPAWELREWSEIMCADHLADAQHAYPYSFRIFERIQ